MDRKNVIPFRIKFPNTVLNSPQRDYNQDAAFQEIAERYPDLETKIEDPAVLDRLSKVLRLCVAERKMGKFKDRLAMLVWELEPELHISGIDLYFIYRDRVFLICWHCLCVWSHIVESEESLPKNFGICPNRCSAEKAE